MDTESSLNDFMIPWFHIWAPLISFSAHGETQSWKFISACIACCFMESIFFPITLDSNWAELNNELNLVCFLWLKDLQKITHLGLKVPVLIVFLNNASFNHLFYYPRRLTSLSLEVIDTAFLFFYHLIIMSV